jgi:hypothetical protein
LKLLDWKVTDLETPRCLALCAMLLVRERCYRAKNQMHGQSRKLWQGRSAGFRNLAWKKEQARPPEALPG